MFEDRKDAGEKLAGALTAYQGLNPLVLAIPRGGVVVGFQIAKYLQSDLAIVVVRKLPFPDNPEAGFGAIAEDGSTYFVGRSVQMLPPDMVDRIIEEQKLEIKRRIKVLREGKSLPAMKNRTIILVDDGIAMGSTMRAAIMLCKRNNPDKIIVAAPVAGPSTATDLAEIVDEVVILEKSIFFRAVAEIYKNWYDVQDAEVIQIMQEYEQLKHRLSYNSGVKR
jgi:putative phosphoribosyl transferase